MAITITVEKYGSEINIFGRDEYGVKRSAKLGS